MRSSRWLAFAVWTLVAVLYALVIHLHEGVPWAAGLGGGAVEMYTLAVLMLGVARVAPRLARRFRGGALAADGADATEGAEAWVPVTPMTTARSRTAVVYFPPNGLFYAIGGEATGGNRAIPIEEYDPVGDTWTDRSLLTSGVSNTGAAVVGDYVYIPGGYTGTAGETALQIFDPIANTVSPGTVMPAANYAHAVVANASQAAAHRPASHSPSWMATR